MAKTSWVELCVSDFEQSIIWFEQALGFRVVAREANEYAELSCGETTIQLAADDAPYWKPERPRLLPPGQRGSGVEIVLLVDNVEAVYRQAQQARADIVRPPPSAADPVRESSIISSPGRRRLSTRYTAHYAGIAHRETDG